MVSSIESGNKAKMFKYQDIRILENDDIVKKKKVVEKNSVEEKDVLIKEDIQKNNKKKMKISELEDDDVRKIVMKGIKLGKKNYESLLEAEIIVSIDKLIGGEVV